MKTLLQLLLLAALTATFAVPRLAHGQAMKPFTEVTSVCPACTQATFDAIKLRNGPVVYARVVAENPSFYCLERWGEQRAVGRDQVESIQRRIAATPEDIAAFVDQILFNDNSVLCGKIAVDNKEFAYYDILVPGGNFIHTGFKSQVAKAYQRGRLIFPEPGK